MNKQTKGWLEEIEIMRAIGIIAVIMIHATGAGTRLAKGSTGLLFFTTINYFLQFAVPMFLLVSAFILAYKYSDNNENNWNKFYLGRARQVLTPYIIWTFIYLFYRFVISGESIRTFLQGGIKNIVYVICFGKGYYHLYFMSVIIQFYLIFPLIVGAVRWIDNKYRQLTEKFKNEKETSSVKAVISFFFVITLLSLGQYAFLLLNKLYFVNGFKTNLLGHQISFQGFELTGALMLSYIMPIGLGLWMGWNFNLWSKVWKKIRWVVYALTIVTAWYFIKYLMKPSLLPNIVFLGIPRSLFVAMLRDIYVTFFSLIFYDAAIMIKLLAGEKTRKILAQLGAASFGVYLFHPLILDMWNKNELINSMGGNIIAFTAARFAGFAVTLGLSWLIVEICSRLPYVSVIFGSRAKKKVRQNDTVSISA